MILNFSHPLTDEQIRQIAEQTGEVPTVVARPVQINQAAPIAPQIAEIVGGITIPADAEVIVNPPGLAVAAILVIEELRRVYSGKLRILRMRPVVGSTPTRFEVGEIV